MVGQTNLFDDVMKQDERFVIVVQALEENGKLLKRTLREYPSLEHNQMNDLFTHLKEVFLDEPFEETNQPLALLYIQT